ncbi:alpha-1,2-glucosyltransferase, glycosyltransferase family 59 protein [Rhodotorula toruloides]|uniref:Dol-P-Glc:Glc(2)Man(9)GlcNAc(2)-PP-Dol alpha-1,2-glucosyltransferase n=1 Tax=Rhodotorula toruloides TaxID=5286 RepID=A0A511KLD3_RHOTO|nr:alpha-1,2-glucosyltransferase, glycosyltransferase family 59 protein [Rhodotorula toruloides]
MPSAPWWTCYTAWVAASVGVAVRINRNVEEPYMDEIFHVYQAQAYCRGDWTYWDPALTTPPGLYLVPAALALAERYLEPILATFPAKIASFDPCSLSSLRTVNLLLSILLPFLYPSLLHHLHTSSGDTRPLRRSYDWEGLVIAMFPLIQWWSWLFYTDMASVVCVLLCWRAALRKRHLSSALLGAVSLLFRQTNIVWVAFVAAQAAIRVLGLPKKEGKSAGKTGIDPLLWDARPVDLVKTPLAVLRVAFTRLPNLAPVIAAYLPVFLAFLAFIRWNGGIVLGESVLVASKTSSLTPLPAGDKQNHIATVHVAQLYYLVAFAGVLFAPLVLMPVRAGCHRVRSACYGLFGSLTHATFSILALAVSCYTIQHYTIAHPFLLADNRHYCFYLWRRVINLRWWTRYALSIGYLTAGRLIYDQLAHAHLMALSTLMLLVGATSAVLIPSPLLEPRYFLLPLLILRLYFSPSTTSFTSLDKRRRLILEAAFYLAIQAACVWLFLQKPFVWDIQVGADGKGHEGRDEREVGRLQRFMW